MDTFGGDAGSQIEEAVGEVDPVTGSTSDDGAPAQCDLCDQLWGWAPKALRGPHQKGLLSTCRKCDYHLCVQCTACELPCHCVALDRVAALTGEVPIDHVDSLVVLYLPPHAMQDYVEKQATRWSEILGKKLQQKDVAEHTVVS